MGPHKSDKNFRNKINKREITPSENAWDRLDAMLTVAEEKKSKGSYAWLFIAATIAGFLLIGTIFFSQTENLIDKGRNEVVMDNNQKLEIENPQSEDLLPNTHQNENIAEVSAPTIKVKSSNQKHHNPIINQSNPINQINQVNQSNQISINPTDGVNEINKNQSLIASINQKTEQQTASAKVDELLAAVAPQNSRTVKGTVKVDAKSLLSEVDRDLNLSFREKLLRTAHRNYQEVAEAVSTRNIQQ